MNVAKMLITKLGHFLLNFMGVLRRALCCLRRRRRMSDTSLPMTANDLGHRYPTLDQNGPDMQSWDSWTEGEVTSIQVDAGVRSDSNRFDRNSFSEDRKEEDIEELFKDMMPTIRRTKKYLVKTNSNPDDGREYGQSSRLAVDIKATSTIFHQSPELGIIDDHVETWEDVAASEEHWNPETAMREQKMVEREKRLAEHQRRKQEKDQARTARSGSNPNRLS